MPVSPWDIARTVWAVLCVLVCITGSGVYGHGRLWEPPSRSSMWRRGYNTTVNINDNELSCGGFMNHWILNRGRCGVCGDPYQQQPRDNEHGGQYASGLITRTYPVGAIMEVVIGLTANHAGSFEFKLCPLYDAKMTETQTCMEQHRLRILNTVRDQTDNTFDISDHLMQGEVRLSVMLPQGLRCTHCVLQWKYRTGTRWGCDANDVCGQGLGPQEEFYGCSDIAIADIPNTVYLIPKQAENQDKVGLNDLGSIHVHQQNNMSESRQPVTKEIRYTAHQETPIAKTTRIVPPKSDRARNKTPVISDLHDNTFLENLLLRSIRTYYDGEAGESIDRPKQCKAVTRFTSNPILNEWCRNTCPQNPDTCPSSICSCRTAYRKPGTVQIPTGKTFMDHRQLRTFAKMLINKSRLRDVVIDQVNPPIGDDAFLATLPVPRDFLQSPKISLVKPKLLRMAYETSNDVFKHVYTIKRAGLSIPLSKEFVTNDVRVSPIGRIRETNAVTSSKKSDVIKEPPRDTQLPVITCTASAQFSHNKDMAEWCTTHCLFGFCPKSVCLCTG